MSAHLKLITSTYVYVQQPGGLRFLLYNQPGVGLQRHLLLIISSFKNKHNTDQLP